MRRVLIDYDKAVFRLGDNIILMQLGAGSTQRKASGVVKIATSPGFSESIACL